MRKIKSKSRTNISREATKPYFDSKRKLFSPKIQGLNKFNNKKCKIPISAFSFYFTLTCCVPLRGLGFVGLQQSFSHYKNFDNFFYLIVSIHAYPSIKIRNDIFTCWKIGEKLREKELWKNLIFIHFNIIFMSMK